MRFRAVMMTSVAFILGLVPLVFATGAAELGRRAVGTAVFAGMLAASSIGIFMVPMLYASADAARRPTVQIMTSNRKRRLIALLVVVLKEDTHACGGEEIKRGANRNSGSALIPVE